MWHTYFYIEKMKRFYSEVGKKKWAFVFAYDIGDEDLEEIDSWMYSLGARRQDVRKSERIILDLNKGFTFSNDELKMSLVCVSDATSEDEWWNTVVHEIDHLQHSICLYYGIEHGSEDCAYLQGELMRLILKGLYK